MKPIFTTVTDAIVRPNERHKTTNYGDESLNVLCPKIWNPLRQNVKSETYFSNPKECVDIWVRT